MGNIKTMVIIAVTSAILGGLLVKGIYDTKQMKEDYNQCLQENEARICKYMYFS